ncbi:transcriptional regulator [Mycetocola zhadangensis]|nr:transcriptional regulator [Mycetocola zhadangensis]
MASVGLTRSTVIGVCDELVEKGWLDELGDGREFLAARKGRPARRYALRDRAAFVVGIDAGYDRMVARVADLRGTVVGSADVTIPARSPQSVERAADGAERKRLVHEVFERALRSAGIDSSSLLAITLGVPAPVDEVGRSPEGKNGFWGVMNPDLGRAFAGLAPLVTVENDANLAALAERAAPGGQGREVSSYISMLVGEGIGSGLMIDGRLVRGRRGGAGEMRFLDYVDGVGSADGLALQARRWASEAIASGRAAEDTPLGWLKPETLTERDVAQAAEAGDPVARAILDRLAERLARICIVLSDLLDVDRVIIGGAVSSSLPTVIDVAARLIAESGDPTAPELFASALGGAAVSAGAVEHALSLVRERALDLQPSAREIGEPAV